MMNRLSKFARHTPFFPSVSMCLFVASMFFGMCLNLTLVVGAEVWGYDTEKGTTEEDIRRNFNLHRGRWWNYAERGSLYQSYGHYRAAERDFLTSIRKRPTDRRNARIYGMHFRDSFAHRERGVSLYYLASEARQRGDAEEALSLLAESLREIELSLNQVESARAEYFRSLVIGDRWRAGANDQWDRIAPSIRIENSTLIGESAQVIFTNRERVALDIRVSDDQSGVSALWVNNEEWLIERSIQSVLKTVPVDVNVTNPWIRIHARDLVGNVNTLPVEVRVIHDIVSPVLLTSDSAATVTPEGLISVRCSVRDNVGLATVQVGGREIDCRHRLEFDVETSVPIPTGSSRVGVRVTDLAGNVTEGHAEVAVAAGSTGPPVAVAPALWWLASWEYARSNQRVWPERGSDLSINGPFSHAVLISGVRSSPEVYFTGISYPESVSASRSDASKPQIEINNYESRRDGYPVVGRIWRMDITIRNGLGVKRIVADYQGGDDPVEMRVGEDSGVDEHRSLLVPLRSQGLTVVEVRAFKEKDVQVGDTITCVLRSMPDYVIDPGSLYSVVAVPLVADSTSHNPPPQLDDEIQKAIERCELDLHGSPRFDCTTIKVLDLSGRKLDRDNLRFQAAKIGQDAGVDLSFCGTVTDRTEFWEVVISLVDNESRYEYVRFQNDTEGQETAQLTGAKISVGRILDDLHLPKDPNEWASHFRNFRMDLQGAIPRIRGTVSDVDPEKLRLYVDVGRERELVKGQKLCFFKYDEDSLETDIGPRLGEAVVERPGTGGASRAEIREVEGAYDPRRPPRKDELIVITK